MPPFSENRKKSYEFIEFLRGDDGPRLRKMGAFDLREPLDFNAALHESVLHRKNLFDKKERSVILFGMARSAHILIENVSHRYRWGQAVVLDDISLTMEPGLSTAIVGRSGCGKSTLLQIACGMMTPSSGKVYVDGTYVDGPSPKWNLMFQEPLLYPWMTVFENASLGLRFAGRMKEAAKIVEPLLEMVGLSALRDVNVQQLSGGQQQRVALARSLAVEPTALFLDEPFSALDAITRRALQRDVLEITRRLDITLVLVTHDLDEAISMGNRVVAMTPNPGRIAAIEDTAALAGNGGQAGGEAASEDMRRRLMALIGGDAGGNGQEDAGAADTTFNVEELPERAGATSAPDDPSSDDITQSKTQTAGARHA